MNRIVFNEVVYDLYKEFCRLKGYKLPIVPLEAMIDVATGAENDRMREFSEWFYEEVITRLEPPTQTIKDIQEG